MVPEIIHVNWWGDNTHTYSPPTIFYVSRQVSYCSSLLFTHFATCYMTWPGNSMAKNTIPWPEAFSSHLLYYIVSIICSVITFCQQKC